MLRLVRRYKFTGHPLTPGAFAKAERENTYHDVTQGSSFFFNPLPRVGNAFTDDQALTNIVRRHLPEGLIASIWGDLARFGWRCSNPSDLPAMATTAESNVPRLIHFHPLSGRRVDHIETTPSWHGLQEVVREEGLVSLPYERSLGPYSRIHQFIKLLMFSPVSAGASFPTAMSDGSARLLELYGDGDPKLEAARRSILSRDSAEHSYCGLWMTERTGGSDISLSETNARPLVTDPGRFALSGVKYYVSVVQAPYALTLARVVGAAGRPEAKLSLFFMETFIRKVGHLIDDLNPYNGLIIHHLKNKDGARALATAEVELVNAHAQMVGPHGKGVSQIATVLNITRLHTSAAAVAGMRRAVSVAREWGLHRRAFGALLADKPLYRETLAHLETETRAMTQFVVELARLLGLEECDEATSQEKSLLRLLTPICKTYVSKESFHGVSEAIECLGGLSSIRDTGLPKLLADAQIYTIWDGTTNVMALDMLRAAKKNPESSQALVSFILDCTSKSPSSLSNEADLVNRAAGEIGAALTRSAQTHSRAASEEANARRLLFATGRLTCAALLFAQASVPGAKPDDLAAAVRFVRTRQLIPMTPGRLAGDSLLSLGTPPTEAFFWVSAV